MEKESKLILRRLSLKRLWFYFRLGHNTYLALIINFAQFLIIAYALFLERFTIVSGIHLWEFVAVFAVLYGIAAVLVGWLHRNIQLTAEAEIGTMTNPYVFKITPGKEAKLFVPLQLFMLDIMRLLVENNGPVSPRVGDQFDYWSRKIQGLLNGEEFR